MARKKQIIATTARLRSANVTSASIIEEHSALDDDAIPGLEAACHDGVVTLLEGDLDGMGLEHPGLDLDEHLVGLVRAG